MPWSRSADMSDLVYEVPMTLLSWSAANTCSLKKKVGVVTYSQNLIIYKQTIVSVLDTDRDAETLLSAVTQ